MPDDDLSPQQRLVLEKITRRFDEQIAAMQGPDFREKLGAVFKANGHLKNPPKAGSTF
jgi:hypothetical protein